LLWAWCVGAAQGADVQDSATVSGGGSFETADVIVDGRLILKVRGATAFPAERRAAEIRQLIIAAAKDKSISPDAVILKEKEDRTLLMSGNHLLICFVCLCKLPASPFF
jgi:hypothetical protein